MLVSYLAYSSILKVEVTCSCETSVDFQQRTQVISIAFKRNLLSDVLLNSLLVCFGFSSAVKDEDMLEVNCMLHECASHFPS
jgi:hypothetical protein